MVSELTENYQKKAALSVLALSSRFDGRRPAL